MDSNGNFVVVWDSVGPGVSGHTTAARRFAANGTPLDAQQFPVNLQSASASTKPVVAVGPAGDFVVTWQGDGTADGWEVYARRFNAAGQAVGTELRVNSQSPAGDQTLPDVAIDMDGNFVVTWNRTDGTATDVMARWYSKDGIPGNQFRVNSTTTGLQDGARIAMNRKGEYVIVWRSDAAGDSDIMAQRFDKQNRPIGGEFRLNSSTTGQQTLPDVSMDRLGNFVAVWNDSTAGVEGISGRWYDNAGNLLHDEFRVVTSAGVAGKPVSVSATPDGEFVISWASSNGTTDEILTQRYTLKRPVATGVRIGAGGSSLIASFSQQMASTGAGSVLEPNNWALQLPDGRWLAQRDPQILGTDPRATAEQFGTITQAYNAATGQWEVTLPLNFQLTGSTYKLVARGSQQDASGRFLDVESTAATAAVPAAQGMPLMNFSSRPTDRTFAITVVPPVADLVDVSPKIRTTHSGVVTVNLDQDVSGLDVSDFRLTRDGKPVDLAGLSLVQVSPRQYTLNLSTVTDVDGEYVLTLVASGSGIQGSTGNLLTSNVDDSFVVDKSLLTVPTYAQTVLGHSPAAYWRLGESAGTTAADASGNGRTGTYQNGVTLRQPGALGGPGSGDTAAAFDSVNDQITVADSAALRPARMTLEAMIRINPATIQAWDTVLMKTSTKDWKDGYGLYYAGGQLHFFLNHFNTNRVSAPIVAGQFIHVVATFDGTAMRLYFNGIVVAAKTTSAAIVHSTAPLTIGNAPGLAAFSFGGVLDEVAVYGRALTNAEIGQHYEATIPATRSYSGLVGSDLPAGYWRLGESSGSTVIDSSGNSRNGTYGNGVALNRPGALSGADGSNAAARFDSVNNPISIPDNASQRGVRISLEAFVKIDSATIQNFDTILMKTSGNSWTDGYGIYYRFGQLHFFLNHFDTNKVSATIPVDQFVHVVATYDAVEMRLYFNGQLVASKAFSTAIKHATTPLLIGAAAGGYTLGGELDEVAIYDRGLSATEVAAHFAASLPKTLTYDRIITGDLPAAYWQLNESGGTAAVDSSGNRLTGTYQNGVSLGRAGAIPNATSNSSAAGFDGLNDQISVADHASLRAPRITLEAFVKINSATIRDFDAVLMKTTAKTWTDGYGVYYQAGQLWFFINNYSSNRIGAAVPVNTFVHVAATYDGSAMRLYINGILAATKAWTTAIAHSAAPLLIGSGAGGFSFGGVIDDVAIYQRALTAVDIGRHFSARIASAQTWEDGVAAAQPAAHWRLAETTGQNAVDQSGNGQHGLYENGVTQNQTGQFTSQSNTDTAAIFDGTDDQIRVADSAHQRSATFSLELVVKINSVTVRNYDSLLMKTTSRSWNDGYGIYYLNGRVYFFVNNYSSNQVSAPIAADQFVHLVASYDGSALRLYINGSLVSSKTWSGLVVHSSSPLLIGAGAGGFSFGGAIDEVSLYKRGLSLFEVREHYRLFRG